MLHRTRLQQLSGWGHTAGKHLCCTPVLETAAHELLLVPLLRLKRLWMPLWVLYRHGVWWPYLEAWTTVGASPPNGPALHDLTQSEP